MGFKSMLPHLSTRQCISIFKGRSDLLSVCAAPRSSSRFQVEHPPHQRSSVTAASTWGCGATGDTSLAGRQAMGSVSPRGAVGEQTINRPSAAGRDHAVSGRHATGLDC